MTKLRLVLFLLIAWAVWLNGVLPTSADGPQTPLSAKITPHQLIIPSLDLNTPIVPVGLGTVVIDGLEYPIWDTAENNVGWHQGSGPPGHIGNTVLAGHSNSNGEIFRHLDEITVGEEIFVATNQGWHHYRVAEKLILHEQGEPYEVRLENARWILPTEDERLTLVTCWPFPSNTHRLLVIAYPVSESSGLEPPSTSSYPIIHPKPSPLSPATSKQDAIDTHLKKDLSLSWLLKNYRLRGIIE